MKPSNTENPVASTPKTPAGPIAVREVAARRCAPSHEQHRCDADAHRSDRDQDRPDQIHRARETIHEPELLNIALSG